MWNGQSDGRLMLFPTCQIEFVRSLARVSLICPFWGVCVCVYCAVRLLVPQLLWGYHFDICQQQEFFCSNLYQLVGDSNSSWQFAVFSKSSQPCSGGNAVMQPKGIQSPSNSVCHSATKGSRQKRTMAARASTLIISYWLRTMPQRTLAY